ncbi:VOC family protein [Halobacteria archaeon AArc-m2/3/4]|uniref:VOC family protein n=1 Tax=Natronoglomus mannanivorans TaxID=2979990 RepID=A0AAP2YUY6_9EURY|nr:VOC family protein [Halobacteria archaeon AArc-xg1-1]MCU4973176.1 VOC family protein [Halobacteria archaeon AArc-m2/3/4]
MHATLDHVMMRVEDLEEAQSFYEDNFGYVEHGRWDADTFTNVHLGPEDKHEDGATLELTYNHDDRSYEMGDGWGHIAVRVEDVEEAYAELMDNGVEDYRPPEENPGYAFVKDPDGHEIEIVERDFGARWSIDHTMIRVEDADEALGYWTRKFEYEHTGRWEADTFANYFMTPEDAAREEMAIELTYNYDGRSYDLGDAWGHVAVRVDDLQDDWEALMTRESEDYRDPESCDNRYAFTKDQDGHEIEVIER